MTIQDQVSSRVKIIYSDIDGTLLDNSHQVSERTCKKITELEHKGVPFVLVSARMPEGVRKVQRQISSHSPMICYSGGLIYDKNGNILYSCLLEMEKALKIRELLKKEFSEICLNAYCYEKWIVDHVNDHWIREEEKITGLRAKEGDIEKEFAEERGVHKLLLMGKSEDVQNVEIRLKKDYPELSIVLSKKNYLEVMHGNSKKSSAINFLCSHNKISLEEAMAFGDGHNDIDMLRAVTYSYAMGNAPDTVKESAAHVTLSNDQEGVFAVIKELN